MKEATMSAKKKRPQRHVNKATTTQALVMTLLADGIEKVCRDLEQSNLPDVKKRERLQSTYDALQAQGRGYPVLLKAMDKYTGPGSRGRTPPAAGDSRPYKAQCAPDDGTIFARIPLGPLGVKKGGIIQVDFTKDSIRIHRADASEAKHDAAHEAAAAE